MIEEHAQNAFDLTLCRGLHAGGCRHALPLPATAAEDLARAVERCSWPAFLGQAITPPLRGHHMFRLAVAACPNGCSRPHIADFAVVPAQVPTLPTSACTGCGRCVRACPDAAITLESELPHIDAARCLTCGACIRACPEGALTPGRSGFRVLLGGRLGRRPRLALEAPHLLDWSQAIALLTLLLERHMGVYRPGLRPGDWLDHAALGDLLRELPRTLPGEPPETSS